MVAVLVLAFVVGVASFAAVTYWLTGPGYQSVGVKVNGQVAAGANAAVGVANAVVYISFGSPTMTTVSAVTNADGGFAFSAYPGVTYTMYAVLGTAWGTATSSTVTKTMPQSGTVDVTLVIHASDIQGTVTDASTGQPISGAQMQLSDSYGNQWCCSWTGSDGSYLLWTLSPGTYTVYVTASGYTPASAAVFINSTATSQVQDFQLQHM